MNELNTKDTSHKKAHGIPCPKCGCTKWKTSSARAVGPKIMRVRVCKTCDHRIRTGETMNSANAPRLYTRDPSTTKYSRRKKTVEPAL